MCTLFYISIACNDNCIGDISKVVDELSSVAHKWNDIGIQLGISPSHLHKFEQEYKSPTRLLTETIDYWMKNQSDISWDHISTVLRSGSVGEKVLAKKIDDKYGNHNGIIVVNCLHALITLSDKEIFANWMMSGW